MTGMAPPEQRYNARKNELCEAEMYILNLTKFEFDSYPVFYDIIEIFMAQGLLYSSDMQLYDGK